MKKRWWFIPPVGLILYLKDKYYYRKYKKWIEPQDRYYIDV